ncbi:MAG: hypothetical protein K9H49_13880 [Bacteroidales bacterium]|nr:hypothetical protein [Bacteroidales bacterium]MCF8390260.1 hypothetical protein [Bacteroidales bacterium]
MEKRYSVKNLLRYNILFSLLYRLASKVHFFMVNKRFPDELFLKRKFDKTQNYVLNLENPKTLNEKLQWLKIHDRKDYYTTNADKYAARVFIRDTFGEKYLIPLVFHTTNYRELKPENLPDIPFAIKTNHGFGNTVIVQDKRKVDWKKLRMDYRRWLNINYYYFEREWQYKNIKPRIIVETLLLNKEGKLPNDYKLNFISGKLEFIYVSVDREGTNKRNIYDADWNPLHFTWARRGKDLSNIRGAEIPPPPTLQKMIEFGSVVAKLYKYVRVDFYDVDGVLYFGEITQSHGGGFDQLLPYEYDLEFGEKINLLIK